MLTLALMAGGLLALAASWSLAARLAASGFRTPEPSRRIGHIDGLRGYLALFVMLSHYTLWTRTLALGIDWGVGPDPMLMPGQVPVAIFFMITGLLFYPKARDGFGSTNWRAFLLSRLFRIYPLSLLSVALVVACLWWRSGFTTDPDLLGATAVNLLRWIAFVDQPPLFGFEDSKLVNAGVFWTLTSEWLFYLAVLPVIALARSATRGRVPGWTTPFWALAVALVLRLVWRDQADLMIHFMLGMFIFQAKEHPRVAAVLRRSDVAVASVIVAALAIAFLPPPVRDRTVMFYAPFLACVACGQSFRGLLSHPASIVLGEVSFGIYVMHGIVLWLGMRALGGFVAAHPVAAALVLLPALALGVVAVAAAAHVLLERPMIERGRRVARSLHRKRSRVAPSLAG